MKHILGIVGTESIDMIENKIIYNNKVEISEDVLNWLKSHDKTIDSDGNEIFIVNAVKYKYLGPHIETDWNLVAECLLKSK